MRFSNYEHLTRTGRTYARLCLAAVCMHVADNVIHVISLKNTREVSFSFQRGFFFKCIKHIVTSLNSDQEDIQLLVKSGMLLK